MSKYMGYWMGLMLLCAGALQAQTGVRLRKIVKHKSQHLYGLPISMVKVPTGTFVQGAENDQDSNNITSNENRHPVLISSFYISTTETTNAQYKEFVNWVRDSLAALNLGGEYLNIKDGDTSINWKNAERINYQDPAVMTKLTNLLLDPSKSLSHKPQIDPAKLVYEMKGFDYQEAAKIENKGRSPKDFVYHYTVQVYPDTLVWMRDFGYSNNEQMATSYFASDKYKNFPVVGVNWMQATAYCDWFTKQRINRDQREHKMAIGGQCRLPTEAEWAYAASLNDKDLNKGRSNDQLDQADKPEKQKRRRGKNREEEAVSAQGNKLFPEKVIEGKHGKMGIYNLADNVSEWTNTSYYAGGANFENRFNPDIQWGTIDSKSKSKRRKVVRGGSWKDTPQFTTVSNRFFEDLGTAHSYIGFRVVVNLPE